MIFNK
jgi:hypothetical protein